MAGTGTSSSRTDAARRRLWAAVDEITQPTKLRVERDNAQEWREIVMAEQGWVLRGIVCDVATYRASMERLQLAWRAYGEIPALWKQAQWAVFGAEAGDGSGGKTPARERTPADLDLMETLLTIRESLGWQLPGRSVAWRKPGDIPDMMRQFAAHVATHEPQHVEWWAFRFEQWGRMLRTHLNALEQGPKPIHLRGAICPLCKCGQVFATPVDDGMTYEPADECHKDGDRKVVPAIKIDFQGDAVRAAQCLACGHAWFRGEELNELGDYLRQDDTPNGGAVVA